MINHTDFSPTLDSQHYQLMERPRANGMLREWMKSSVVKAHEHLKPSLSKERKAKLNRIHLHRSHSNEILVNQLWREVPGVVMGTITERAVE